MGPGGQLSCSQGVAPASVTRWEMSGSGGHHSMGMGDDGIVTVEPGREATLTEVFDRAGTVVIGCHQPGHWESGMRATVDVG